MGFNLSLPTPWGSIGIGKSSGPQKVQSFRNPGSIEDPVQSLQQTLMALDRLAQGISERGPSHLRSLSPQGGPVGSKPISIPGIPFQIGGGLGTDPSLQTEQLQMGNPFKYDPIGGAPSTPRGPAMNLSDQGAGPNLPPMGDIMNSLSGVKRRTPNG
jgi:hypothetical protein